MANARHFDLDGAWTGNELVADRVDLRAWGPRLRFSAPTRLIEQFFTEIAPQLPAFVIYGSGDFHHLTALWARPIGQPFVLISFDNHPDWDVRPPKWSCGAWVNRALDLPNVEKISVWGCDNFECWWPRQIFGNRRAERAGRLEVHPWVDDRTPAQQSRRGAIRRDDWRERFAEFCRGITGAPVYLTIDIDCLVASEAVTNWENGRFTTGDIEWGIGQIRQECRLVGGDLCGAFSEPRYARSKQRFASEMDHPKLPRPSEAEIREINFRTLAKLWPVLVG